MKITVCVKINSKNQSVELMGDGSILIRLNVPPVEGQANKRILELLSEFYKRPKSSIKLVSGLKSKKKVFEIT